MINLENKLRYECNATLLYWYDENGYNEQVLYGYNEVKEICMVEHIDYIAGNCVTKNYEKTIGIACGNYDEYNKNFKGDKLR